MRTRLYLCLTAALLIAGCVPSLHSIVTEKTLTYDPALVGRWEAQDTAWTITGDPNDKSYAIAIIESENKQSPLTGRLVEIQGKRFLDLYPSGDAKLNTGDWFNAHLLPVHGFWKLDKAETGFTLSVMNPDTIKDLLAGNPQLIKHEVVEEDRIVLTDTPENLQKFLIAGLGIEKFYGDAMELKPVKD